MEKCLWMSFCDPKKAKGDQFLGVIIMYYWDDNHGLCLNLIEAHIKMQSLGINPGGEIEITEVDKDSIDILIFMSQTPDYHIPPTAPILQHRLGLSKATACFDEGESVSHKT